METGSQLSGRTDKRQNTHPEITQDVKATASLCSMEWNIGFRPHMQDNQTYLRRTHPEGLFNIRKNCLSTNTGNEGGKAYSPVCQLWFFRKSDRVLTPGLGTASTRPILYANNNLCAKSVFSEANLGTPCRVASACSLLKQSRLPLTTMGTSRLFNTEHYNVHREVTTQTDHRIDKNQPMRSRVEWLVQQITKISCSM